MATTLRTLLKLPEAKSVQRTSQHEDFVKEFRLRIGRVNTNLQRVASQAGRSVHKPLDELRSKVIAAQQKALALIDPVDASKAEPTIKRVLEAVDAVEQKASQAAETVGSDREQWLTLEEELDDILQQASELEDAGHPKAPVLRKVGEAARDRAKDGKFREAAVAVKQLRPKFHKILAEQQGKADVETPPVDDEPPAEDGPREGLTVLVRDQTTGEAIEGASVEVGDQSDTTSSNGLATVELPVGVHDYSIAAEGFEAVRDSVEIIEGDNPELVIEMIAGADTGPREGFTVFVKDWESGDAVVDAEVTAGDQTDTTSSNGLATFELPVGTHDYEVVLDGYESASGQVEIIEGDNPELVVELYGSDVAREGLTILVKDAESGDVVEGAEISIGNASDVTSSNGLATVELPAGEHDYEVSAEGYATASGSLEILEGSNRELVIELAVAEEAEREDDSIAGDLQSESEEEADDDALTDELADAERFVGVWDDTLSTVSDQVEKLCNAMGGSDDFGISAVREGLSTVMDKFPDLDLTKLVDAAKANDRASYDQTLRQTAKEVREVRDLLAHGPLLSTIDENPFVSTNVHATVTGVLEDIVAELGI